MASIVYERDDDDAELCLVNFKHGWASLTRNLKLVNRYKVNSNFKALTLKCYRSRIIKSLTTINSENVNNIKFCKR